MPDPRVEPSPNAHAGGEPVELLTEALVATDWWTDEMVADAGFPVVDVPFVTVGGGLGSFAMVDTLRIAGAPTANIAVLTNIDDPFQTYRYLANNSQIPDHERLRSDSSSTIDNIWGFPGYALREAIRDKTIDPLLHVAVEPELRDFWTPRAGDVYASLQAEAHRTGWQRMVRKGQVRLVRRRHGGGYFTVLTPPPGTSTTTRVVYRSRFVHLAVGYPGVRFLPDLQAYRETYRDFSRVVNAYEPHDYVYEETLRRPSTVMVRGSGIVGSRVLQRLMDDREQRGAQTTILHLFRNYVHGPQGDRATFRRDGGLGFAYQGFNFTKALWGGQFKEDFDKMDGHQRAAAIALHGGTNTPKRQSWQRQIQRGLADGSYRQFSGEVADVAPGEGQTVSTVVAGADGQPLRLDANFIIDATGLESDIAEHRLLGDLLAHTGAQRNPFGRLDVDARCELTGTSNSFDSHMYASGSSTLGGPYAGVDSFLGLQYSAQQIADHLAQLGFVHRIGTVRSVREWWRWMRGTTIADVPGQPTAAVRPVAAGAQP